MENMTFEELIKINCFSKEASEQKQAAELLEQRYCCEIRCADMDESVRFAHHARGCTIVAAKLSKNVVIFQNVTIGSNMRYNKIKHAENQPAGQTGADARPNAPQCRQPQFTENQDII